MDIITVNKSLAETSWARLVDEFIRNSDHKETTKETYRKSLNVWLRFLEHHAIAPDINLILQYKNYLIELGLSAYSISVYLTALKMFLDYLVNSGVLPFNPAKGIKGLKKPKSKRDALTTNEIKQLLSLNILETVEDYRNRAILLLKLFTGLRDISIINADIADLKVKEDKNILYYQSKGHDTKDEFVILISEVHNAINEYLIRRGQNQPEAPLFASCSDRNHNNRLTTQSIRIAINALFKKAGITRPEIKPHSLRHTAITFSILGGADIMQAKEMAGHSDITTTAGYFHDLKRLSDPAEHYIEKYLSINGNIGLRE